MGRVEHQNPNFDISTIMSGAKMAAKGGTSKNLVNFQDGGSFKGNTRIFWNFQKIVSSGSTLHSQKISMDKWIAFVLWASENFLNFAFLPVKIAGVCSH